MPWYVRWYDWTGPQCTPNIDFEKYKGKLLRREVIPTFEFERKGLGYGGKGYIPERLDAPIWMEARGVFLRAFPLKKVIKVTSDDGSRLWINGKLVIDNWGMHSKQTVEARAPLSPLIVARLIFFDSCRSGLIKVELGGK